MSSTPGPPPTSTLTAALSQLPAKFRQALALYQQGKPASAQAVCEEILAVKPDQFDTLNMLAMIAGQANDFERAVKWFDRAIEVDPNHAATYCNRGFALQESQLWDAALASYDRAITLKSDYALAHNNRGNVLRRLGRLEEALAGYDRALAINSAAVQSHYNRGLVLVELGRLEEAAASYGRAIAGKPDYAEAYSQRAVALYLLRRFEAAVESYDRAIAINPRDGAAHSNRGNILREMRQLDSALASYNQAIALNPGLAGNYLNRGIVFYDQQKYDAAIADYDRAIAISPGYAAAYYNRGNALHSAQNHKAAAESYLAATALDPGIRFSWGDCREARMQICDWGDFESDVGRISAGIERQAAVSHPFSVVLLCDSPQLQRKAAEIWVREMCPPDDSLAPLAKRVRHDKIRIGYFSPDFRIHPLSTLAAELFETHDRSKFEITAFSFGADTQDAMRRRMEQAFDRFLDVRDKSDRQIALLARELELDIAVDLAGFTQGSRPQIFALRAAPLQIGFLGYLGTMGADYMDYLIADPTVIPKDSRHHYRERILYLPSYQPNDSKRTIAERVFTRNELDLPPLGFVFCCFNTNYKIAPSTFDSWMRILDRVEHSVLFLYAHNDTAASNLRKEAHDRGLDPDRLVFGKRLPVPEYLARYRAADLFLDTRPYNAGTTASDALWAGLPVLTCAGAGFASRVAASLLRAIDLPELITHSQQEYEDLAVQLATDPERLAGVKRKLAANRLITPLFDTLRYTKHLEGGYREIYGRYQADLPPEHVYLGPTR